MLIFKNKDYQLDPSLWIFEHLEDVIFIAKGFRQRDLPSEQF